MKPIDGESVLRVDPVPPARGRRSPKSRPEGTGREGEPGIDREFAGLAPGVRKDSLRRLGRGDWPIEALVDLHGDGREEARRRVFEFVLESVRAGRRVVAVNHGRGLGSPGGQGVLRSALAAWLRSPPLSARVLAFCPALPREGGEGVTRLLLRKAGV